MPPASAPDVGASDSKPGILTLPSIDSTAELTLALVSPTPLLTLSVGNRTALAGHISGLPPIPDTRFTLTSVSPPSGIASYLVVFTDSNAQLLLEQAGPSSFHISISGGASSSVVEAAFNLGAASWFGLGLMMHQHWPLQDGILELGPFYPFDNGPNGLCTILDPTLVSTDGAMIVVDDTSRCLHVALNASPTDGGQTPAHFSSPMEWGTGVANFVRDILPRKQTSDDKGDDIVRFQSRAAYDWPHVVHPWLRVDDTSNARHEPQLKFCIGGSKNVRTASEYVLSQIKHEMSHLPKKIPPLQMMKNPIWSTWARYKDAVTQKDVLDFAHDIVDRGLPRSVMGIDDRWSVKYGDLDFDKEKFPDPAAMIRELHDLGFIVTVWVVPFANTNSEAISNPETRKYFVHSDSGELGEFAWWRPTTVAALDVTDQEAYD